MKQYVICDHVELCLSFKDPMGCVHERYHKGDVMGVDCEQICVCNFLRERTEDFMVRCISIVELRKQKLKRLSSV